MRFDRTADCRSFERPLQLKPATQLGYVIFPRVTKGLPAITDRDDDGLVGALVPTLPNMRTARATLHVPAPAGYRTRPEVAVSGLASGIPPSPKWLRRAGRCLSSFCISCRAWRAADCWASRLQDYPNSWFPSADGLKANRHRQKVFCLILRAGVLW